MSALFDLCGRTAVITGSSRGIGRAIAEALAAHGANVVISSRKQERCNEVAAAINAASGGRAIAVAANISKKEDVQRLVEQSCLAFERIDILVCNAASNPYYGPLLQIADHDFTKTLNNNVLANHWLVQLGSVGMIQRRAGSIIMLSSIGSHRGSSVIGAYTVSKAAMVQLAANFAVELGPHNVRVNCIAPGLIRTEFARQLWENQEILESVLKGTPLARLGEPNDIAGVAVFLASAAGRYITGQCIVVDGGATITMREG